MKRKSSVSGSGKREEGLTKVVTGSEVNGRDPYTKDCRYRDEVRRDGSRSE